MGALIAFEFARTLRRKYDLEPEYLLVSGHRAPQIPDTEPPIHTLPEAEFIEKLRCLKGTPDAILENAELMQIVLPVLRADFEICETYAYLSDTPLNCAIAAFGGNRDAGIKRGKLRAWRKQTKGAFSQRVFPGNHFFLHSQEQKLLQVLSEKLNALSLLNQSL